MSPSGSVPVIVNVSSWFMFVVWSVRVFSMGALSTLFTLMLIVWLAVRFPSVT